MKRISLVILILLSINCAGQVPLNLVATDTTLYYFQKAGETWDLSYKIIDSMWKSDYKPERAVLQLRLKKALTEYDDYSTKGFLRMMDISKRQGCPGNVHYRPPTYCIPRYDTITLIFKRTY